MFLARHDEVLEEVAIGVRLFRGEPVKLLKSEVRVRLLVAQVVVVQISPKGLLDELVVRRVEDGKVRLVGDVDFDSAMPIAGGITPVPGGVGPMTIACLLSNTLQAAEMGLSIKP